jgi:hypothetical protein
MVIAELPVLRQVAITMTSMSPADMVMLDRIVGVTPGADVLMSRAWL